MRRTTNFFVLCVLLFCFTTHGASRFNVIAFYTGKNDLAHISFVHEANQWFPKMALKYHFAFDSTTNWTDLNTHFLSHYQVVIFLDTRPEAPAQRAAFEQYMKGGGAWMGFHFSAFALTPSAYPQNWDWYHNVFLGSGEYVFDKTNRTLSFTFADQIQDKLVIDSLLWLGKS